MEELRRYVFFIKYVMMDEIQIYTDLNQKERSVKKRSRLEDEIDTE